MDGSIVRINLCDFMTFEKVVFDAGPNLNVIIGVNGSGKSSIVCAMVLGLGGKPRLLGRAVTLNSYIRMGCRAARIEIELKNSRGSNYVITRTITEDGKSSWQIGSNTATQKQVEDLVNRLNIQVNNLCQFLPQDKVADFSKMNPQLLLENTEKCVGSAELFDHHMQLKELRKQHIELERQLSVLSGSLQSEEQRNDRIVTEVGNMAEKKTLLQMLENLKQKRAWVMYDVTRSRLVEMTADRDKAAKTLVEYENRCKPMEGIVMAAKAKVKDTEHSLRAMNAETSRKLTALKEVQESIEQTEDTIEANIRELEQKIHAEQLRQNEVRVLLQQISKLQNDLKGFTKESVNALKTELDVLRKQMNEKGDKINRQCHEREKHRNDLDSIIHDISLQEREKQKIQDVANQRLELLRRRDKDKYEAVMWLRENKSKFRHRIYEPMVLEINIKNPSHAKYVECIIPNRDLLAFTCEDKEDMNNFVNILRDQKNLKINVLHSGSEHKPFSSFKPSIPISDLRHLGFHTYLADMITAPEAIMKYLCRMCQIHNIPVGDASTFTHSDHVPGSVNCFFSDNHIFLVKKSKYSGEKSTRTSEVSSPFYLAMSMNVQLLQRIQEKLSMLNGEKQEKTERLEKIQKELHQDEMEMEGMRSKRHSLMERMEQQRTVEARLRAKQRQLENLEHDRLDAELEKAKCKEDNQMLVLRLTEQNVHVVDLLNQCSLSVIEEQVLQQELNNVRNQTAKKENESRQMVLKCTGAKSMLQNIEEKLYNAKVEAKRFFEEAKTLTGGISPADPAFHKFRRVFHVLGDTVEELDNELQDTQAKADCLGETDDTVMQEFETRKVKISSLAASIKAKERECEKLKEKMARIDAIWLPPLKKLVSQINKTYGECFARLGCVGEVTLFTGQNEKDYEQYGLKIKVKFRDGEQLQELTQHLQSGGERAVATAIYLISLQELTRVPFCCVDEINQGMDAVNERMIFELLAAITKRSGGAQYFLLTPKLLPSLFYDHVMSVRCVYNGTGVLSSNDLNYSGILASIARLKKKQP